MLATADAKIPEARVEDTGNMQVKVWDEEKMPPKWELSELVTVYKRKGDPLDCGNIRGIKLLKHVMKILEKVIEGMLRGLVSVNGMQFVFSPGRGTMDAAFIIMQQQEKHPEVNMDLYYTFVDLEKAHDQVPRDLVYWCLRQQKILETLIRGKTEEVLAEANECWFTVNTGIKYIVVISDHGI
ncbi:uncharacterized protein LOC134784375 [Penaeus indicus]|uniref:uncharacterized protein LOC134784375 n=1 Tax=Penaeus indicus TaxID=29960 RepID=UPI00300CE25C